MRTSGALLGQEVAVHIFVSAAAFPRVFPLCSTQDPTAPVRASLRPYPGLHPLCPVWLACPPPRHQRPRSLAPSLASLLPPPLPSLLPKNCRLPVCLCVIAALSLIWTVNVKEHRVSCCGHLFQCRLVAELTSVYASLFQPGQAASRSVVHWVGPTSPSSAAAPPTTRKAVRQACPFGRPVQLRSLAATPCPLAFHLSFVKFCCRCRQVSQCCLSPMYA